MNPLAQWFTWEGVPCQVGTRSVKLAGLSSKSTCNSVAFGDQGAVLAPVFLWIVCHSG